MHIIINNAQPQGTQCDKALQTLVLPHLRTLLQSAGTTQRIRLQADDLTSPGEHVHALCLGLPIQDGLVPWAAWQALQMDLPQATGTGWAQLSLCHWQINADHVAMQDPASLQVTKAESQALMDAMREFFAEDGITLYPGQNGTWLAQGQLFAELPTASLERACGNKVDAWLPRDSRAKPLRRLQNEMQMLLYRHPVNDERAARRLVPINSFWASASGMLPAGFAAKPAQVQYIGSLREFALNDDAAGWVTEWQRIDADILSTLPGMVTLCSEVNALTLESGTQNLWGQIKGRFFRPDIHALLQSL